jgi:hypothetical protein
MTSVRDGVVKVTSAGSVLVTFPIPVVPAVIDSADGAEIDGTGGGGARDPDV